MKQKPISIAIAGCGIRGRDVYGRLAMQFPDKMQIVALAESNKARLMSAADEFGIPCERCFSSVEALLNEPKLADVLFVCTQDRQHVSHAIPALKKGYHLLLEKPVSTNLQECREVEQVAKETGREVCVCHVLRYTQFYQKIRELIHSDVIGDLVTIQACEGVGYWHHAHSYVRGNWRDSNTASPMILAKCCHDMDILLWLSGKHCESVSSFGSLLEFRPDRAPEGAAMRCLDGCKAKDSCPYDAEKIYLTGKRGILQDPEGGWPISAITSDQTAEGVRTALETGPYGRCVYHCDNNVVDHQVVNMHLQGGPTISFAMSAFSSQVDRTIRVMGTRGEITGDMEERWISVAPFGKESYTVELASLPDDFVGHGGGDRQMLLEFCALLQNGKQPGSALPSISASLESHYVALAAEESRLQNGKPIKVYKS